jgi:hypothetical protein
MNRLAIAISLLLGIFFAPTVIAEPVTIARLVKRNHVITISQGNDGQVLYSIATTDNEPLASNLSDEQLQASYPEIYDSLRPAIATPSDALPTPSNSNLLMLLEKPLNQ